MYQPIETSQGASDIMATGCTVSYDGAGKAIAFFNTKQTAQCCGAGVASLKGKAASLVTLEMNVKNDTSVRSTHALHLHRQQ
jgi:hypothetical protein